MKQNIKEGIVIDKAKEGMEAKKGTDFVLLRILILYCGLFCSQNLAIFYYLLCPFLRFFEVKIVQTRSNHCF